jgi:hypothetical protein
MRNWWYNIENILGSVHLAAGDTAPWSAMSLRFVLSQVQIFAGNEKYRIKDELRPLFNPGHRVRLIHGRFR